MKLSIKLVFLFHLPNHIQLPSALTHWIGLYLIKVQFVIAKVGFQLESSHSHTHTRAGERHFICLLNCPPISVLRQGEVKLWFPVIVAIINRRAQRSLCLGPVLWAVSQGYVLFDQTAGKKLKASSTVWRKKLEKASQQTLRIFRSLFSCFSRRTLFFLPAFLLPRAGKVQMNVKTMGVVMKLTNHLFKSILKAFAKWKSRLICRKTETT